MSFYTVHQYVLAMGASLQQLHDFLAAQWLPAAANRPVLVLEGVVTAPMPQVLVITRHDTLEQYESMRVTEPAGLVYESLAVSILRSTAYSPELVTSSDPCRYYEYRLYQTANTAELAALHERFAGPEIQIFQRCGIHPVLYAETLAGDKMPNLVYLTPFSSLAAREEAWNTFRADPEWIRVRTDHATQHGPIPKALEVALYRAATYSPVK